MSSGHHGSEHIHGAEMRKDSEPRSEADLGRGSARSQSLSDDAAQSNADAAGAFQRFNTDFSHALSERKDSFGIIPSSSSSHGVAAISMHGSSELSMRLGTFAEAQLASELLQAEVDASLGGPSTLKHGAESGVATGSAMFHEPRAAGDAAELRHDQVLGIIRARPSQDGNAFANSGLVRPTQSQKHSGDSSGVID